MKAIRINSREHLKSLVALAAIGFATNAEAQATTKCPILTIRWMEDCGSLEGASLSGLQHLRYFPVTASEDLYLSFGGEVRARWETQDRLDFGIGGAPQTDSAAVRALAHANIRMRNGPRLFAQFSYAQESGRTPGPRLFDESNPDIAQLFIDAPFTLGEAKFVGRIGRQELPLGRNHLVGLRDGVVLRRSFDAVRADVIFREDWSATAFYGAPVRNQGGAFDDRRARDETFSGLNIAWRSETGTTSFFLFHRGRDGAAFFAAAGDEQRTMAGVRIDYALGRWTAGAQAGVQIGEIGGQAVRAWGVGGVIGWTPSQGSPLRYDLTFGVVTGDGDLDDGRSANFDPLYPNLAIFSVAPLYYPTNQINLGLSADWEKTSKLALRIGSVLLMRYTTDDAIYSVSGRPLGPPADGRISAVLGEIRGQYRLTENTTVELAYLHAAALKGVRSAGGRDVDYAHFQVTTAF
jgi:hypothetical protein